MHSVVPDHMFQYLGRTIFFFLQSLYDATTKRKLLDKDPVQTQWENKRFYLYDIPLDALFISLTFYAEEKKQ
jgi:hypothetical protein